MKPAQRKKLEREREKAKERLAKSESIHFRCTEDLILRLNQMAAQKNLPVTRMIREWVGERLEIEESAAPRAIPTEFEAALFSVWKDTLMQASCKEQTTTQDVTAAVLLLNLAMPKLSKSDLDKELLSKYKNLRILSAEDNKELLLTISEKLESVDERLKSVEKRSTH